VAFATYELGHIWARSRFDRGLAALVAVAMPLVSSVCPLSECDAAATAAA